MYLRLARVSTFVFLFVCWAVISSIPAAAQGNANPPGMPAFVQELHHDLSRPLRDIEPEVPHHGPNRPIPLLHPKPPSGPAAMYADPALQTTLGPAVSTSAGNNFDGVGVGFGNYTVNVAPPDTNGAVGRTQYVQWVNLSFAVFDKSDGSLVYGPAAGNTLWSGFGGACQNTNDGDIIAQYDKLANKWVMAQLSYAQGPPYLLCLAISQTSDALGAYYRYSLSYDGNLNDYPKLGVWPDGYYVTANMFEPIVLPFFNIIIGYNWVGPEVCGLDRASMLAGGPANPVCTLLSGSYSSLLPADLDGTDPPPDGSPNYLLSLEGSQTSSDILRLWKFKPNFSDGTYTLDGPTNISVPSYNEACGGGGTCIPQQGTTQDLDSLADRLMYRLAYRNLGGTEILLANHAVDTTVGGSSTVGIRWYEIRDPNTTPSVYQSGTYAPDAKFRWMGSMAMDHVGNIALGYSVSGNGIHPGIRYTGRLVDDPLGLGNMESENSILEGTGSQATGLSRWGDYSALSVDPVDDCTFWYTNEYLKTDGTFNWSTRVASFKFPSCSSTATADFSLAPSPISRTITQGDTASYDIKVSSQNGFSGDVNLSISAATPCPLNATCTLSASTVTVPDGGDVTATLSVTNTGSTQVDTYSLTVDANDGGSLSHSTTVGLTVTGAPDFTLDASPTTVTVTQGTTGLFSVSVSPLNGFNSDVTLSVTGGCPTSPLNACAFNTSDVISGGNGSQSLNVATDSTTTAMTYDITISGTGGGVTHTTNVSLTVQAAAAGDFSISASPGNLTLKSGQSGNYTVTIAPSGAFNSDVMVTANCPSGFACHFSGGGLTTTIHGGSGSDSYVVTNSSAPKRTNATITFDASGGGQSHSTSVGVKSR